jgi:vacuolar-type H+-ATPase subunit H
MSKYLIERLNEAEVRAESIIDEAKKYRKALLAKARDAAEEELEAFSKEQDAQLKAASAGQSDDDATKALEAQTASQLAAVDGDFQRNSAKTVEFVVSKVLDVPLALSSTQTQALIAEASKPAAPAKQAAPKPAAPKPAPVAAAPAPAPTPAPVAAAPPPVVQAAPAPTPTPAAAPAPAPAQSEEEADEAEAEAPAAAAQPELGKAESKKKSRNRKQGGAGGGQ